MLPFVFSLALPLLAGVNPPTWSLREVDEFPDLRTLKAAGLLLPGTCRLVVEALPPTNPAPPLWWMRCDWLDAPRSPEPGVSVTACDLDDRYQKFGGAAVAATTAAAAAGSARLVLSQAHTRASATLRDREAEFEPWTALRGGPSTVYR